MALPQETDMSDTVEQRPLERLVMPQLLPCPFCGGPVKLEQARSTRHELYGDRHWFGVTCRNTINLGGTCCMEQVPSASKDAAITRWNMRNGVHAA